MSEAEPAGRTVDPRVAFDELAQVILSEHSLDSIMSKIAELAKQVVPGADEVSVTLVRGDEPSTIAFTGQLAMDLDERQYERGFGPCLAACEGNEVVLIPDMATEERFRDWTDIARDRGVQSSLSLPVPVHKPVAAALNIYATAERAFDDDSVEVARTLASYAGVALANMHLHESTQELARQMETAMRSRAVIEQAKGVLMMRERCSADEAFQHLVLLSQNQNRKLRDVAEALVDQAAAAQGK